MNFLKKLFNKLSFKFIKREEYIQLHNMMNHHFNRFTLKKKEVKRLKKEIKKLTTQIEELEQKNISQVKALKQQYHAIQRRNTKRNLDAQFISELKSKIKFYNLYINQLNNIYDRLGFLLLLPEYMRNKELPLYQYTYLESLENMDNEPIIVNKNK